MSNFYPEEGHSFVDKTAAFAKYAGIAAIGLSSVPFVGKGIGFVGSSFARGLSHEQGLIRRVFGSVVGVEDTRNVFSDSFNFLAESMPATKKIFQSSSMRDTRRQALADSLKKSVAAESMEAFEKSKHHIVDGFEDYIHGNQQRIADNFLSDTSLKRFMESTKGISFSYMDKNATTPEKILSQHRRNLKIHLEQAERSVQSAGFDGNRAFTGASGKNNYNTVADEMMGRLHSLIGKENKQNDLLGYNKSHKLLRNKDLLTHEPAVEAYLERIGVKKVGDVSRTQNIYQRTHKGIESLFADKAGNPLGDAERFSKLKSLADEVHTGLAIDHNGQVVSLAHNKNFQRNALHAFKNEVQIPLLPLGFNVPGTIGQFMTPEAQQIKNLGLLRNLGEVKRMGLLKGIGKDASGFSIGDHAFSMDFHEGDISIRKLGDNQRFLFLNNNKSATLKEFSEGRAADHMNVKDLLSNMMEEHGLLGTLKHSLLDVEHHNLKARNFQHKLFDLQSSGDQLSLTPKSQSKLGAAASMVFHPKGLSVSPDELHPQTIVDFISRNNGDISHLSTGTQLDLYRQMISKSADASIDLSPHLKKLAGAIDSGDLKVHFGEKGGEFQKLMIGLMHASDNPSETLKLLNDNSIFEKYSDLTDSATNEKFLSALTAIGNNPTRLFDTAKTSKSVLGGAKQNIVGSPNISQLQMNLQKGLLWEVLRGSGMSKVAGIGGEDALEALGNSLNPAQAEHENVRQFIKHTLNIVDNHDLDMVIDSSHSSSQGVSVFGLLGDVGKISQITGDPLVTAMMREQQRAEAMMLGHLADSEETSLNMIKNIAKDQNIADVIRNRGGFLTGVGFDFTEEVEHVGNFTVLPTNAPSMSDLINNPGAIGDQFIQQAKRGFGTGDFIKGAISADHAQGYIGTVLSVLGHMPDSILKPLGLGLPKQFTNSMGRGELGFYAARILPLYVGMEAYKNFNANAHQWGMPGLDGMSANLVANTNLAGAKFKDMFGLTETAKNLIYNTPGLDMYFHPRSEDEYREHLFYGQEEVRMGRGFIIGNKQTAYGGNVDFIRPSFYQRWKSGWTEADNVSISNPEYSWLPSLTHPFSPIKRALNPHWQEHLAGQNRPYGTLEEYISYERGSGGGKNAYLPYSNGIAYNPEGGGRSTGFLGMGGHLSPGQAFEADRQALVTKSGGGTDLNVFNAGPYQQGYNKAPSSYDVYRHGEGRHKLAEFIHHHTQPWGFYVGLLRQLPFYPSTDRAFSVQEAHKAFSSSRQFFMGHYGEASGPIGEVVRRFIGEERQDKDAYNPLPNTQASWMPEYLRKGDPQARVSGGDYNIPGSAFFKLHPYIKPMKARGSMIGGTEDEIVEKLLDPIGGEHDEAAEERMAYGTYAHKLVMRQMRQAGFLYGAEVQGYDPIHNISATIETINRGATGKEVIEIKTRGSNNINEDVAKYEDQLMFYMYLTGAKRGWLAHVNRDDPTQVRLKPYDYDPDRMQGIFDRLERARGRVQALISEGKVSPFETLGLLERVEVLARTAPDSSEFEHYKQLAEEKGGFGGMEQRRYELALKNADSLKKRYNLYPDRNVPTETQSLRIDGITSKGELLTERGLIKLAGVKFDHQAFSLEDPETVLAKYGINVGSTVPMTLIKGQFGANSIETNKLEALIGKANRQLIHSDYAHPDYEDRHPLAQKARSATGPINALLEHVLHSDSMFNTKFLRVRTGLEQFERGEVYGTDDYSLKDIKDNYITPTINSLIHKNPFIAAPQAALITSLFLRTAEKRIKFGGIAGAVAFTLASLRSIGETVSGKDWTPNRYEKSSEFEEYFDILKFVKEASIAEKARHQHTNDEGAKAAFDSLARDAERKASSTMYAFDTVIGTLQEALRAIPTRHKEIAESIITTGTEQEKNKFYRLLPDSEKRVLGKFLGIDEKNLPKRENLEEYFKHHFLPDTNWKAWNRDIDLKDIEVRAREKEGIKIQRPSRRRVQRAEAFTENILIPRMDNPTARNIKRDINRLVSSGQLGNITVDYSNFSSPKHVIKFNLDLERSHRDEITKREHDIVNTL